MALAVRPSEGFSPVATGSYFDHKLLTFLIRQATPRPKLPMDLGQLVATDVITENCAREGNENHHRRAQTLLLSPCEGTPPAVGRTASRTAVPGGSRGRKERAWESRSFKAPQRGRHLRAFI